MENNSLENRKILVVDDDNRIRLMLEMILKSRGAQVILAEDGCVGFDKFKQEKPDLIIMDVMMPKKNGFECTKQIRAISSCPIIMLTAKGEEYDQMDGFEAGVDDYVVKPFLPNVLVARIESLLRRSANIVNRDMVFGKIKVDEDARQVCVDLEAIELSKKEYDLLLYLINNRNISLSRDQILQGVWGYDYLGSDSTVDTHINRLRNKLKSASYYIVTKRGFGYKFDSSVESQ